MTTAPSPMNSKPSRTQWIISPDCTCATDHYNHDEDIKPYLKSKSAAPDWTWGKLNHFPYLCRGVPTNAAVQKDVDNWMKLSHAAYENHSWACSDHQIRGLLRCNLESPVRLCDLGILPKTHSYIWKVPANESPNPVEHAVGPDHEHLTIPRKDGDPRKHHDLPDYDGRETLLECLTSATSLLGSRIRQESTWSPTSSVQWSAQNLLFWEQKSILSIMRQEFQN